MARMSEFVGVGWYRDGKLISTWYVSRKKADEAIATKPDYLDVRRVENGSFRRNLADHDAALA